VSKYLWDLVLASCYFLLYRSLTKNGGVYCQSELYLYGYLMHYTTCFGPYGHHQLYQITKDSEEGLIGTIIFNN
jgi:hypothetical protein